MGLVSQVFDERSLDATELVCDFFAARRR